MKLNISFIFALATLSLNILACQAASRLVATPTPEATATSTPHPTSTVSPTPTLFPIEAETTRKVVSGGFEYAPLRDFDINANNHEVFMSSPDESVTILLSAEAPFSGTHINTYMKYMVEYFESDFTDTTAGERLDLEHAGASGVFTDFTGKKGSQYFQARAAYLRPEKGKQLLIMIFAYGEGKWESRGQEAYSTVLERISFFPIEPWIGCPVASNREYGYSKERPIKIGGKFDQRYARIYDYLSALLGPRKELVSYYDEDTLYANGTLLNKYNIHYGNERKTLYIDTYNYETPKAPFGMTCSGPFPQP